MLGHGEPVGEVRAVAAGGAVSGPDFQPLDDVVYGRVDRVGPMIRRVIAENPSKFTYRGTGTYIVGQGEVAVVDPGPVLDSHRDALAAALRRRAGHGHLRHPLPQRPLARWRRG